MIVQSQIISLLNEVLGQTGRSRKGDEEICYFCKCGHPKRKLEVHIDPCDSKFGYFNCWVCSLKGKSLISLLKLFNATRSQFDRLYAITGDTPPQKRKRKVKGESFVSLPPEFIQLSHPSSEFKATHALAYLRRRGITDDDILRYNIGYCAEGEYRNRVIVPSYDAKGQLNFFMSRSFYDVPNPHKSPAVPKNFVGFEIFVNWDYEEGVTLCEGVFDALSIRKNAIPLFGKIIPDKLKERIVENRVKRVNMVLDKDAIKSAVRNAQDLRKLGVDVHLVRLNDKDPSTMGFERINELIRNSRPMELVDLVYSKLFE